MGIADATDTPIVVRPDLHEIGASGPPVPGMIDLTYHMEKVGTDRIMKTAADLRGQHPLIDTSGVAQEGNSMVLRFQNVEDMCNLPHFCLTTQQCSLEQVPCWTTGA